MYGGLEGPKGPKQFRAKGNIRSNSAELIREAVFAGIGISLLSTWDVGPALRSKELSIVLPEYRGIVNGCDLCSLSKPAISCRPKLMSLSSS